jgi:hypothetical protein
MSALNLVAPVLQCSGGCQFTCLSLHCVVVPVASCRHRVAQYIKCHKGGGLEQAKGWELKLKNFGFDPAKAMADGLRGMEE